jgi:TPR repeat protein
MMMMMIIGKPHDVKEAARFLRLAAKQGHAAALRELSVLFGF